MKHFKYYFLFFIFLSFELNFSAQTNFNKKIDSLLINILNDYNSTWPFIEIISIEYKKTDTNEIFLLKNVFDIHEIEQPMFKIKYKKQKVLIYTGLEKYLFSSIKSLDIKKNKQNWFSAASEIREPAYIKYYVKNKKIIYKEILGYASDSSRIKIQIDP